MCTYLKCGTLTSMLTVKTFVHQIHGYSEVAHDHMIHLLVTCKQIDGILTLKKDFIVMNNCYSI